MKPWGYYSYDGQATQLDYPIEPEQEDYNFTIEGVTKYNSDMVEYERQCGLVDVTELHQKARIGEFYQDCRSYMDMIAIPDATWTSICFTSQELMKLVTPERYWYESEFVVMSQLVEVYKMAKRDITLGLNDAFRKYEETEIDEEDHR